MALFLCSGAKLKCSMGSRGSNFTVIPTGRCPVSIKGNLVGTIMDNKPFFNIKSFGQCRSLANPTVAAATAASNGKLQPMPCVPNTAAAPWMGGKMRVCISGEPTLLETSKLTCAWAGMIEITDPGQDFVMEGTMPQNTKTAPVKSDKKAKDVAVAAGSGSEPEDVDRLTVKDFAEVLERIEKKKDCYESARHYAAYHVDYWELTKLARRYVDETDAEKKEQEKNNDPNLMPSRFMLLYGAADDKLRANGRLDKHHDDFAEPAEHEVSVANLRKALRLLGHDVEESGPFDEPLLYAFLKYLGRFGRVEIDRVYEDKDGNEKYLEDIANEYGAATWKYFYDESKEEEGGEKNGGGDDGVNHDEVKKKFNADYGNELIREKGGNPRDYRSSICYHYPWAPFYMTMNGEYEEDEEATYKIYDSGRESDRLIGEGTFRKKDGIKCLLPDSKSIRVFVDGREVAIESDSTVMVSEDDDGTPKIKRMYWAYWNGEKYVELEDDFKSNCYIDLYYIIETKNYKNGEIIDITLNRDDGQPVFGEIQELNLKGPVSDNKVVFKNLFNDNGGNENG